MNLLSLFLTFPAFTGVSSPLWSAASSVKRANEAPVTSLKIYNANDYIGENVIEEFQDYVYETDGVKLEVTYDTFDTNEIMLSQIETGSRSYDLVCPSDYMIQKMMSKGMLIPFVSGEERLALYGDRAEGWDDNYSLFASPYLQDVFKNIKAPLGNTGTYGTLEEYARGYMWGTLGLIYNPTFHTFEETTDDDGNPILSEDDVKVQMKDWNVLWDKNYKGTFQIKDSMRDTFSVGLMKTYDELCNKLLSSYESGDISEDDYHNSLSTVFNNVTHVDEFNALLEKYGYEGKEDTSSIISSIEDDLVSLRANSYGLEVDSGKSDILDGKLSGIGIAWSGDAVYSIDTAEELGVDLYYSIPKTGGNIWFDGWVMPSTCKNQEYAQKFIDYISTPSVAAENMDYIGYTPFIAGDDILELVRQWYDPRAYYIYAYDETADDYYYDEDGEKAYKNGSGEKEVEVDGEKHTVDFGEEDMSGSSYEMAIINGEEADYSSIAEEEGWSEVDLSYFFDGSLSEDYSPSSSHFYSDTYEEVTAYNLDGELETVKVGRAFYAQYPPKEDLPKLCIMEDYGDNNSYVLKMWESVKSGSIPTAVIVILIVELGLALGVAIAFFSIRYTSKKLRRNRRKERSENA